jgi:hypothetical protein
MSDPAEKLMIKLLTIARQTIAENQKLVDKIIPKIEVTKKKYVAILLEEAKQHFWVEASFAVPPHTSHTPEELEKEIKEFIVKKLERDKRLFLDNRKRKPTTP